MVFSGDGWSMAFTGLGRDGKPLQLGPNGVLILNNGRQIWISGTGFIPNAEVVLYLNPPSSQGARAGGAGVMGLDTMLGVVRTDANGSFGGVVVLPSQIAPGNHVLQAVGRSPANQVRALSLGVEVQRWIVLDKGTRKPAGKRDRVSLIGATGGLEPGTSLTVYVKLSGQSSFKKGKAQITVQSDGSFAWSRLLRKGQQMTVYVSYMDTNSNRIVWRPLR